MESQHPHRPLFRAGDRVRLISPIANVAVGTHGAIVSRFLGGALYDVRFDGHPGARVVEESKLALVPRERSRGQ
jgi:hypothetical protein